jgi:hypothetical protein
VEEVEFKDWQDIAPLLNCRMFDIVSIDDVHQFYIDDEGLCVDDNENGYFQLTIENPPRIYAGKALFLDYTWEGESVDTSYTVEEVRAMVRPYTGQAPEPHMEFIPESDPRFKQFMEGKEL